MMDSDISQTTSPGPHPLSQTPFPPPLNLLNKHTPQQANSVRKTLLLPNVFSFLKQKGHWVTVLLFMISSPSIQTTIYLFRSHPENIGFKIYAPHLLPCQKFSQIKSLAYMESMESLRKWKIFLTSTRRRRRKRWQKWSDIKENKIVKAFEMQQMYVCWSSFHLSSTLSICLIFSYSLKLLKIADATVVSECQSKCNVHLLLFFFLFAQLWALKRALCVYCI